jgi:hypothetical protein
VQAVRPVISEGHIFDGQRPKKRRGKLVQAFVGEKGFHL